MSSIYSKNMLVSLVALNVVLQVASFTLVKAAAESSASYLGLFLNYLYVSALLLVVIRSIVWQLILKRIDLSKVYPINSIVPVLILVVGATVFNETITLNNILGAIVLVSGVFILVKA